jgi:hypothetical protein
VLTVRANLLETFISWVTLDSSSAGVESTGSSGSEPCRKAPKAGLAARQPIKTNTKPTRRSVTPCCPMAETTVRCLGTARRPRSLQSKLDVCIEAWRLLTVWPRNPLLEARHLPGTGDDTLFWWIPSSCSCC